MLQMVESSQCASETQLQRTERQREKVRVCMCVSNSERERTADLISLVLLGKHSWNEGIGMKSGAAGSAVGRVRPTPLTEEEEDDDDTAAAVILLIFTTTRSFIRCNCCTPHTFALFASCNPWNAVLLLSNCNCSGSGDDDDAAANSHAAGRTGAIIRQEANVALQQEGDETAMTKTDDEEDATTPRKQDTTENTKEQRKEHEREREREREESARKREKQGNPRLL